MDTENIRTLIELLKEVLHTAPLPDGLSQKIQRKLAGVALAQPTKTPHPAIVLDPEKESGQDLVLMASSAWIRLPGAHPERALYLVNKAGEPWSEEGLLLEYWPQGVGEDEDPLWSDFVPLDLHPPVQPEEEAS